MRCDPDIIFVGEVLEPDSIRACVNAGLTGHLVLSLMNAEDAVHTLVRMMEMEVEPYLLASAVIATIAQRLARRVCANCTEPYQPSPELLKRLEEKTHLDLSQAKFAKGKGCEQCRQTGYRGRLGLYEILELVGPVREAVARGASADELRRIAQESGMITMLRDGIEKAMQGRTTIDEVLRVLTPI
jgi:type II secretory ATPase GspE/PulE/Tfp pilus assembly ATPase PilB-like protein